MATGDLTTIDAVKALLKITGTADDANIAHLVTRCSAVVANYLNRNLLAQTHTETYDGNASGRLSLRQTPITAVAAVAVNGISIPASPDGVLRDGFTFDQNRLILVNRIFYRGIHNVSVTYTAGYASVPYDVEEAVIELVGDRLRMAPRLGEQSRSLPQGGSITYDMSFMSDRVQGVLSNYRRLIPA